MLLKEIAQTPIWHFLAAGKARAALENFLAFFRSYHSFNNIHLFLLQKDDNSDGIRISLKEQTALLVFLGHCFMSMEVKLVRDYVQKLVSLSMWESLLESRRDHELKTIPRWKKFWKAIQKKDAKETGKLNF